jgi:hypothetical protein
LLIAGVELETVPEAPVSSRSLCGFIGSSVVVTLKVIIGTEDVSESPRRSLAIERKSGREFVVRNVFESPSPLAVAERDISRPQFCGREIVAALRRLK